jgi:hypothetical protein
MSPAVRKDQASERRFYGSLQWTAALWRGRGGSRIRRSGQLIFSAQRKNDFGLLSRGVHRFGLCLLARAATSRFLGVMFIRAAVLMGAFRPAVVEIAATARHLQRY